MKRACSVGLLLAAGFGCTAEQPDGGQQVAVARSALTWSDGRTVITVNADVEDARCEGTQAMVGVTGSFTATAALEIVMITSVDGVAGAPDSVVVPGDFTLVGRDFLASFGTDANIPDGPHRIDVCFAVKNGSVVSAVRACLPSVDTDIDCSMPPPPSDTTPPVIVGSAAPVANAQGWNNSDVTVSFMCSDADSGIASCSGPSTLSAEGAGQSVTGMAMDNAGNGAMATVSGINIDKTPPSLSASRSVAPNGAGWNNTPVTVSFDCGDALSGVASCSAPVTLSANGSDQAASGEATDNADNIAYVTESPINIDMVAPTVTITSNQASYTVDQTVVGSCMATDSLSGIASDTCVSGSVPAYVLGPGTHSFGASATDRAGNSGSGSVTFTVDLTTDGICKLMETFSSKSKAKPGCVLLDSIKHDLGKTGLIAKLLLKVKICALKTWLSVAGKTIFDSNEIAILRDLIDQLQ